MDLLRVEDYATSARASLPPDVWDYLQGGSGAEATLAANRAAYGRLAMRPRVLTDVSACDLSTTLLGQPLAFPVAVAPMAFHRLVHTDGELATASAAGEVGTLFVVSIFATQRLEAIAASATGPLWLQLYWLRRREVLAGLASRAAAAGFGALVLTVDTPRVGRRLRDIRNGFTVPPEMAVANVDALVMSSAHENTPGMSAIEQHSRQTFDTTITWSDLAWLRRQSPLPLLLKGIVTAEDTQLAVDHGVDGIIVSNHGGRQLDGAIAALEALPEVVAAAAGRLPVLVDGGIRSGGDVFKALALGAQAVLIGRPVLWGLAHGGAAGAAAVLRLLRDELEDTMVLAGRPRLCDIGPSAVRATHLSCGCA